MSANVQSAGAAGLVATIAQLVDNLAALLAASALQLLGGACAGRATAGRALQASTLQGRCRRQLCIKSIQDQEPLLRSRSKIEDLVQEVIRPSGAAGAGGDISARGAMQRAAAAAAADGANLEQRELSPSLPW